MAKIFLTGATGYIGGDALFALLEKHPDLESSITALVRNSEKGALIAKQYPQIKFVYGSLDDVELITKESAASDLVLHFADADNVVAVESITAGLADRASRSLGAFLIHTSGTGVLTYSDLRAGRFGFPPSQTEAEFSDSAAGISAVVSLPDDALHRGIDKVVLAAGAKGVITAIVCPPTISGRGRGPGNRRSVQWPLFAKAALERGKAFQIEEGKNVWDYVHIQDLSNTYLALTEAALDRIAGGTGGKATWNQEGYYFSEANQFVWGDVAKLIGEEGKKLGVLDSSEVVSITKEEAAAIHPYGSVLWGSNSRGEATRARELLGWEPKFKDWKAIVRETVQDEALLLGLIKTHAQEAAGI